MKSDLITNGQYRINQHLDTFSQFAVMRKVTSVIPMLMPVFVESEPSPFSLLMAFSMMKDDDVQFVTNKCLSVVSRYDTEAKKFYPVMNAQGQLMYNTITPAEIMELTAAVIQNDMFDFFSTALASLPSQQEEEQGQTSE